MVNSNAKMDTRVQVEQENDQKTSLTYKILQGKEIEPYLPFISKVRVEWYKNFPDFYSVNKNDSSSAYTSFYYNVPDSIMIGAFDRDQLVGWAMGLPLKNLDVSDYYAPGHEIIAASVRFKDLFIDLNTCFYCNEVLMLPEYRQQGIEDELFKRFEQAVKETKKYEHLNWFHLDLGDDHPRRPKDFVDGDKNLLQANGFIKTDYNIIHAWDVIQPDGSVLEQQKFALVFWVKKV